MCILCGNFVSAFASSLFKLKPDSFIKYVQFTLGIHILLDKIISNDPQILFWVPLQIKPKLYVFAVCQQRMTALHISVEIGTAFQRKLICYHDINFPKVSVSKGQFAEEPFIMPYT